MMGGGLKKTFGMAAAMTLAAPLPAMADTGLAEFSFAAPAVIPVGLMAATAIWFIMRTLPPKPREVEFPPARLLQKQTPTRQTTAEMPLWQRIMRATALALATLGLAQPGYDGMDFLKGGKGPVVIAVNNGAFAGPRWEDRAAMIESVLKDAEREDRGIVLFPTVSPANGAAPEITGPVGAAEARVLARNIAPVSWPQDNMLALETLSGFKAGGDASVVFLDDGLDSPGKKELVARLRELGRTTVIADGPQKPPHLLASAQGNGNTLAVRVLRPDSAAAETLALTARDSRGQSLTQTTVQFDIGQTESAGVFSLPPEIRNQLAVISINGEAGAGATLLLDENTRIRSVGIVDTTSREARSSLLNRGLYISEALKSGVNLRAGGVAELLDSKKPLSVLVLPDSSGLTELERKKIEQWVRGGGTLLRFADSSQAAEKQGNDNLIPSPILSGVRSSGGGFSGGKAGRVKEFDAKSPFNGISIPSDVTIKKQILTKPGMGDDSEVWAQLEDNTPLVSASRRGEGRIVFFHSAIDREWMDLHLSGGPFIDMLRAVVTRSRNGVEGAEADNIALPPLKILDGRGKLAEPPDSVPPMTAGSAAPSGLYGDREGGAIVARNLYQSVPELKTLPSEPDSTNITYDVAGKSHDLTGAFLLLAMALAAADHGVLLKQRGLLFKPDKKTKPSP